MKSETISVSDVYRVAAESLRDSEICAAWEIHGNLGGKKIKKQTPGYKKCWGAGKLYRR